MNYNKKVFLSGAIIRFIVSISIIWGLKDRIDPILLFFIIFVFSETLDSDLPKLIINKKTNNKSSYSCSIQKIIKKTNKCLNPHDYVGNMYTILDKLNDIIVSIFMIVTLKKYFTNSQLLVLQIFLYFRIFGIFLWFLTKNNKIFIFFPNIFEALFLSFLIINKNKKETNNYKSLIIVTLVSLKMCQEYLLHYN